MDIGTRVAKVGRSSLILEQALFQEGWENHYSGMVEWLPASITGGAVP